MIGDFPFEDYFLKDYVYVNDKIEEIKEEEGKMFTNEALKKE